jgi:hypothetical protein
LRVFNAQAHLLNNKSDQEDTTKTLIASEHSLARIVEEVTENISETATPQDTTIPEHITETITVDASPTPAIASPIGSTLSRHYESTSTEFSNDDCANDEADDTAEPDESWALELLRESGATEALLANSSSENDFIDDSPSISASKMEDALDEAEHLFIDIINNDLQDSSANDELDTLIDNSDVDDDSSAYMDDDNWTEGLLVDENTDPGASFIPSNATPDNTTNKPPNSMFTATGTTKKPEEDAAVDPNLAAPLSQEEPTLNLQFERDDINFAEEKPTVKRWPWLIGCLLLLASVVAQVAWIKFDELSTQSPYRSYYAKACAILQCQLTDISDISQIRSTHLIVHSHPDEKGALIVDAIIANNADFKQPFPGINLIFLDIQGKPIASRAFQPKEYVKGELFGETIMPARQSIQLSLSIVDPGDKAVNYRLDIVTLTPQN